MNLVSIESHSILSTRPLTIRRKDLYIYPATPSFLKNYLSNAYPSYLEARKKALTPSDKIYDERLRRYQNEDVDIMLRRTSNGLFNEQRLGKTPTVLTLLKYLNIKGKILIITPKSITFNWCHEVRKWLTDSVCVLTGTKDERKKLCEQNYKVYIAKYKSIIKDYNFLPEFEGIVLDEAHALKNFRGLKSNQSPTFTKIIIQLSYRCKYKIALTGTPSSNYAWDFYPILHFLYPNLFTSYQKFIEYYFDTEDTYTSENVIQIPKQFKHGKQLELQEFLETISIQRKRKDHMKWIPKIDHHIIELELTNKERKYYHELYTTFKCKDLNIDCSNLLMLMLRLRQMCCLNEAKKQYILDYIEDNPNEQIIITSFFTEILEKLHKEIPNSRVIFGRIDEQKRHIAEKEFNNKAYQVLIGNIDIICEGMKLEQGNTIIVLDPSLTGVNNLQLYDRIIPTSEEVAILKNKQQVIRLINKNTIDGYIMSMIENKKSSSEIINNFKKYLDAIL